MWTDDDTDETHSTEDSFLFNGPVQFALGNWKNKGDSQSLQEYVRQNHSGNQDYDDIESSEFCGGGEKKIVHYSQEDDK